MEYKFKSLSIVTLNVRGLRDSVKRKAIFLFCKRSAADLIFLQEIHSGETDVRFWRNQWGNSIFFSHGSNHSAGTAIILHRFKGTVLETLSSD